MRNLENNIKSMKSSSRLSSRSLERRFSLIPKDMKNLKEYLKHINSLLRPQCFYVSRNSVVGSESKTAIDMYVAFCGVRGVCGAKDKL